MDKQTLIHVLQQEIERATGETGLASVALATSRAVRELGHAPDQIRFTVSPNIYKYEIHVGVPGTGMRGMEIAGALGAFIDETEAGLAILDYVDETIIERAKKFVAEGRVSARVTDTPDPLYIRADVFWSDNSASAVISNDYSDITEVHKNGKTVFSSNYRKAEEGEEIFKQYTVGELVALILTVDSKALSFLIDAARLNYDAAMMGINDPSMKLGPALDKRSKDLPQPFSASHRAQVLTGAAAEARMLGLKVPIMAIAGSGNHGITNFLGVYALAEELGVEDDRLAKALAITSMITVYIKGHVGRMTAFCGCAIAPATGIAAGSVYLLGGNFEDMVHAMQSVIGTFSGMLCDGAKESCAFKISTAASAAIQFAYLAMDGAYVPARNGIVGNTIEETIAGLGILNDASIKQTEKTVIGLIERIHKRDKEIEGDELLKLPAQAVSLCVDKPLWH